MPELANPRHERFCREYMIDQVAAAAYVRTGYAPKNADVNAAKLMVKPSINSRIAELRAAAYDRFEITQDRILREMAKVAFGNLGRIVHVTPDGDPYIDLSKADEDDFAALAEVTVEDMIDARERDAEGKPIRREVRRVKVKQWDKLRALEMLAKNAGLLKERVEMTVSDDFARLLDQGRQRALGRAPVDAEFKVVEPGE